MVVRVRLTRFDSIQAQSIANRGGSALVRTATFATARRADVTVPIDTGRLAQSQNTTFRDRRTGSRGTVGYRAPYATPVHEGARARVIRPRRKRALAFTVRGRPVVVARVNWPGHRGQPWLFRALLREAGRLGFRVRPGVP